MQASSSSHGGETRDWLEYLWHKIVDAAAGMTVDDPVDDIGGISLLVDAVQTAGLDDSAKPGAAVGSREERVFAG